MRKLLRAHDTLKFLGKADEWTDNVKLAVDFPDSEAAVAKARQIEKEGLELYYSFGDDYVTNWDFAVPIEQLSIPGSSSISHLPRDTRSSD